ncbi:MAG: pyruvate formate-lyase-activating protein [Eubacteriales bacterium]|nr:pyruvate formate-lyase-activating protein [Eubacteriales bacterium]
MNGRVHSFQSLGTLDGPGVRFVVFLQGCNLRCGCCHNPDTWSLEGGSEYAPQEVLGRILRLRSYYKNGGVTVSGGEPLLQSEFVRELFALCRQEGLHTCLDTSGSVLSGAALCVLDVTDRVLLDIKYTCEEQYRQYVGCSLQAPMQFLRELDQRHIPTTLRQVVIPGLTDGEENLLRLKAIAAEHACVDGIELLPFKKICRTKYDAMGIPFPFADRPTPDKETMARLNALLSRP